MLRNIKFLILCFGVVAPFQISFACSCFGPYEFDFFKNVKRYHEVVFGVVEKVDYSYEYHGLFAHTAYLTVLDTMDGARTSPGHSMVVTGQDGLNCGEIMDGFSIGDTLVLALNKGFYYEYGLDTFYLDGCRKHYHHFTTSGPNGVTIPWLKERIRNIRTGISLLPDFEWKVYPNPAMDVLNVVDPLNFIKDIQLLDVSGQILQAYTTREDNRHVLHVQEVLPGIYQLICILENGQQQRVLVVKI